MPYRIDLTDGSDAVIDRLVELGALDIEPVGGGLAAIVPDSVEPAAVARAIGVRDIAVSPALGRDAGSVWVVSCRPVRTGRFLIVPADDVDRGIGLRLIDGPAFGSGLHPTTVLCLEALDAELDAARPASVLDVGTGSGVLALAALCGGVPRATAIDRDADAIRVTIENAGMNGLRSRMHVVRGGPESLRGTWPLVLANILAAPLIEIAPALVRCVRRRGRLVLSGVRVSLAADVERAYRRVGMRQVHAATRDGWTALTLQASW